MRVSAMLFAAACAVAAAAAAAAVAAEHDHGCGRGVEGVVPWTELRYKATKLVLGATSTVQVDLVPAASVADRLLAVPGGQGVLPTRSRVAVVTVSSVLPFGRDEVSTVWIDPVNGAALQFQKLTRGRKQYRKVGRYVAGGGYFALRWAPRTDAESRGDPAAWTDRREQTVRLPSPPPAGHAVTDSYALLFLLAASDLNRPGERVTMYLITDERLVEMTFHARELTTRRVAYTKDGGSGIARHRGDERVRRITVTGRALDAQSKDSPVDLGFLGMRGELTVYMDPSACLPVEIVGDVHRVGELTVRLEHAVLRPATTRVRASGAGSE